MPMQERRHTWQVPAVFAVFDASLQPDVMFELRVWPT